MFSIRVALCAVLLISICVRSQKSINREVVFQINPNTNEELDIVNGLKALGVKFWIEPNLNVPSEAGIPKDVESKVRRLLKKNGIPFKTTEKDLSRVVHKEDVENRIAKIRSKPRFTLNRPNKRLQNILTYFAKYNEITKWLYDIQKEYPSIATVWSIGKSFQGRQMTVIKLGIPMQNKTKKAIWLEGGIHPREWLSPATALYTIHKLVTGYRTGSTKNLLEWYDWYIIPCANPDGYEYTFFNDTYRFWRKNTRPINEKLLLNESDADNCLPGVDLNRNWDQSWNLTNRDPCSEIYGGEAPFSEPETRNLRDAILKIEDLEVFISMHAYSQLWMFPWSSSKTPLPDKEDLLAVSLAATKAIFEVSGNNWTVGTPPEIIYPAYGGSIDWAKENGIKYAFAIELRPGPTFKGIGFLAHPSDIRRSGEEMFAGFTKMAEEIHSRNN